VIPRPRPTTSKRRRTPEKGERYFREAFAFPVQSEPCFAVGECNAARVIIGLAVQTVGNERAVAARQDFPYAGFIDTRHHGAIERRRIHELYKRVFYIIEAAIAIQMIGLYIGNHGDGWEHSQE
jgi:hypothetical protein